MQCNNSGAGVFIEKVLKIDQIKYVFDVDEFIYEIANKKMMIC